VKLLKELAELSWWLIERKVAYYRPEAIHSSRIGDYTVSDEDYDAAEVRYLELCRKLGHRNTLVHKGWPGFEDLCTKDAMMEIDDKRPSVQLVLKKMGSIK
jgi:hypothetical protein